MIAEAASAPSTLALAAKLPSQIPGQSGRPHSRSAPSAIPEGGQTQYQFWNIKAFDVANPELSYKVGNLGRNVIRRPGSKSIDLSMHKNFRIHENHLLNFRFDAFNAPNHPNWNSPPSGVNTPTTFGIVTSAKTMRQLQLALKYQF